MGVTGLAGLSAGPALLKGTERGFNTSISQDYKIIYRTLGKTGIKLPIVSMGVMNADNPNLVAAALDAGIIHLDTAWGYQRGRNETMIGGVIKDRPRDSYVIATKVPGSPKERRTGYFTDKTDPANFHKMFDESLQRLGIEYVDILYLHNVTRRQETLFEPLLKALEKEKKQGRTKFIGVTTHRNEHEVINAVVESKLYDVVLTAYNFQKKNIKELRAACAAAVEAGLGVVAMKTQAGVYWDKEKTDPINMKAALKWALNEPHIHTAIPGFTAFDQLALDMSVMEDLTLTPQEIQDLRLDKASVGLYCQQCEQCLPQCPQKLPVPDLMRGYMYVYGYGNLEKAQGLVESLDLPDNPCKSCGSCSVVCAQGFDVKDKVTDISRMKAVPSDFFG